MRALYTMTFKDFLDEYESSTEWQAIKSLFNNFPAFYIQGIKQFDGTTTSVQMQSLYELYCDKYAIYEIGSEYIDLFFDAVRNKIKELTIKYLPKINTLNQIVYTVGTSGRSDALVNSFTIETDEDYSDYGYIYPINTTSEKLSGKTTNTGSKTEKIPLSNKSMLELTKEILSLPDLYNKLIEELGSTMMMIL